MLAVPPARIRLLRDMPARTDGRYVLYWCTSARRAAWNFALDRAAELCEEHGRPLLVLEALRADYPHASRRVHAFVLRGMVENHAALEREGARHYAYVEPAAGAARGLLATLAAEAVAVVTDESPAFFLPRMLRAASALPVRIEVVDGCGLLPLRDLPTRAGAPREFLRAVDFRRHLQRRLPEHLANTPRRDGLRGRALPAAVDVAPEVRRHWPEAELAALLAPDGLDPLPIDARVRPVADVPGGRRAALAILDAFLADRLGAYGIRCPAHEGATSGLSPYLHFGHVSAHEIVHGVLDVGGGSIDSLGAPGTGSRTGWWGLEPPAEAFLDQVVTWRELSYHTCHVRPDDHASWTSLPAWARTTLEEHAADPREPVYERTVLEEAGTHDALWNAAQGELRARGTIHSYLRMLWGKKILEWSRTPREALATMIELNDRWALDGRDPCSYGGILWVLGRHDRAFGPERPVFGKVRYMSSPSAARKLRTAEYVACFGVPGA